MAEGATRAVAAWILHLRGAGAPVTDARRDEVLALVQGDARELEPGHLVDDGDELAHHLGIDDERIAQVVSRQMAGLQA